MWLKNLIIVRKNLKRAYQKLQLNPEDFDQLSGLADKTRNQSTTALAKEANIMIQLTGNKEFPGEISLYVDEKKIEHLCFLGIQGKGLIDKNFLKILSKEGIPVGEYTVASPFSDEEWPKQSFSANGALRLKIVSESANAILPRAKKKGIAIHGRDFYPLLEVFLTGIWVDCMIFGKGIQRPLNNGKQPLLKPTPKRSGIFANPPTHNASWRDNIVFKIKLKKKNRLFFFF